MSASPASPSPPAVPVDGSFKLTDGSRKRGRPRKTTPHPQTPAATTEPKRRGRLPKLRSVTMPIKKKRLGRPPKSTAPADPTSVYIIPHSKQLKSDISRSFSGAAAIVFPKNLLAEKGVNNSIVIFPNVIQSLIDASARKKPGRPRSVDFKEKPAQSNKAGKRKPGRPRKKSVVLNQELMSAGEGKYNPVVPVARGPGRPWKIRDMSMPGNVHGAVANGEKNDVDQKRPVGRPRKRPLIEGFNPSPAL